MATFWAIVNAALFFNLWEFQHNHYD